VEEECPMLMARSWLEVGTKPVAKVEVLSAIVIDIGRRAWNNVFSAPSSSHSLGCPSQILHHLAGHLNVVCVSDVYEDKYNVCIVMDCCSGGELFDAIVARGSYSEKDAAELIRVIVGVVAHCHQMGVIHRDL
jgi:serine/threonine protein kinase